MRPARLKSHFLQNARYAVAHSGRRREGQINNTERHAQPPGRLLQNILLFANKATPKTLNRATGVVLVVLGAVVMLFRLLT